MPRRRSDPSESPAAPRLRAAAARHIRELGLADADAYRTWCRANGFPTGLDKTPEAREAELAARERIEADARRRRRMHANPRRFIVEVCSGELRPHEAMRPGWREAAEAIDKVKGAEARESLKDFLLHVEAASELVFATTRVQNREVLYIDALIRLHERRAQWVRPADTWRPTRHNARRQFGSLVRHLIASFDVPAFMDEAWLHGDRGAYRYRDWFAHVGAGRNLRTARTLYPMTKMTVHHFLTAPDDCTIEGALVLADVRVAGGGPRLARAVMGTRLGGGVERDEERRAFWLSVYRFFAENPLLDLRHVGPIVDYLANQRFEPRRVMTAPGVFEEGPPAQPKLSMARRTPETLLRQVEAWHGELRKSKGVDGRSWRASGHPSLTIETGPAGRPEERETWRFMELLTGADPVEEGRRMCHCIATYAASCEKGLYSVWSLERRDAYGHAQRALTIAVDRNGQVTEARGARNRLPDAAERNLLERWMAHARLRPGPYLYGW